jgi:hypothetical protein
MLRELSFQYGRNKEHLRYTDWPQLDPHMSWNNIHDLGIWASDDSTEIG